MPINNPLGESGVSEARIAVLEKQAKVDFPQFAQNMMRQVADVRATSAPVPTGIVTATVYQAKIKDQRLSADSPNPVTIIEPHPSQVDPETNLSARDRRYLRENIGDGVLTLQGTFYGANPDGSGVWVNPVLKKGETLEFKSYFVPDPDGAENAPADFQIDGESATGKGDYRLQIINHNLVKLPLEFIEGELQKLENAVNQIQLMPGPRGPKGDKGDDGATPTNQQLIGLITPLIPAPIKGDPGVNATTTAAATASANGLMSAGDKSKLDLLPFRVSAFSTPPPALNASLATEQVFDAVIPMPAESLKKGDVIPVIGYLQNNTGSSPPAITLRLKINGVTVLASAAISQTPTASNRLIKFDCLLTVQGTGTGATLEAAGIVTHLGSSILNLPVMIPAGVTPTVNTQVTNNVQISVQYSLAGGTTHNIQLKQFYADF